MAHHHWKQKYMRETIENSKQSMVECLNLKILIR